MTIDVISPENLQKLWEMIQAESHLHFSDEDPKTFEEWVKGLENKAISIFSIHKGKKLVGAIGFSELEARIAGIHFIPEERGTKLAMQALHAILIMLFGHTGIEQIGVKYHADNIRVHKFLRKAGAIFDGVAGTVKKAGQDVPMLKAYFSNALGSQNDGQIVN